MRCAWWLATPLLLAALLSGCAAPSTPAAAREAFPGAPAAQEVAETALPPPTTPAARIGFQSLGLAPGNVTMTFLDHGHAPAILLQWDGGAALLDGTLVANTTLIAERLQRDGIERLDALLLTRRRPDEGDCRRLVDALQPARVLGPEAAAPGKAWQDCNLAFPVEPLRGGSLLRLSEQVAVRSLAGGASLTLLIETAYARVLVAGDMRCQQEADLVARYEVPVDVLVPAYHGGDGSTCLALLDATSPRLAVVQAGDNPYGEPAAATLARLGMRNVHVVRTDLLGEVRLLLDQPFLRYESGTVAAAQQQPAARDDDAAPSAPRERRPHLRILATEECPNAGTEDHRASVAILRNDSNATIELHGFALASTEGHTFTFPPGRTIGPGQTVRVHTCEMPEGARDFVWRQLAWCGVLYPLVLKSHGATVDRLTPEGYDAARLKDCKQGFRATATSPPR